MADVQEVIKRLHESKPPATDSFTYLTILEKSMSPAILPALQDILDDAELTREIGWDMVEMLIKVPGSGQCLERIARLGNPREVILKVLEVMEMGGGADEDEGADADAKNDIDEDAEAAAAAAASAKAGHDSHNHKEAKGFVTLVGMLGILHKRLQVKAPSRFLHTTLDTINRAYDPTDAEETAAIIELVRVLAARKRPPLPTRQSSTPLDTPFQESDPAKRAPDPEASKSDQKPDDGEPELMNRLLQSFITCVIEAYVNLNGVEWASRLLEYTFPERIVPGRRTTMQAFKEVTELQARDALIGQLVATAGDLGLSRIPPSKMREVLEAPLCKDPLLVEDVDPKHPDVVKLSTGGFLCLAAYWMFASDIFDAHYDEVDMSIFPDHHLLLLRFLGDDPQGQIARNPGTIEALVMMAIKLEAQKGIVAPPSGETSDGESAFMSYHHLLTLISVFHPNIRVRNAATVMAGHVFHADPSEDDKLAILQDLFENCMFSSLQACAVAWFREEIIAARASESKEGEKGNKKKRRFTTSDCIETLQYALFPSLTDLEESDPPALWEFWAQNAPYHLQVANFALFLFGGAGYKDMVPAGMAAGVEHRYVEPLVQVAKTLMAALEKKEIGAETGGEDALLQISILKDTLERVPLL